ncbi:MAG: LysR family transcriptional regulator [Pseudomonadota bacterium]
MDIANLRAFIAVVETGSFSAAAAQLFVSQPAVSKRIGALEATTGHKLFDRIHRRALLTPAGRTLLPTARTVLAELESCQSHLDSLNQTVAGHLHIATSHHIGLRRLPALLRRFIADHPAVDMNLQLMDSEDAVTRVADNTIELAVVTLPLVPPAGVVTEPVWVDQLRVVVALDHPLANVSQPQPEHLAAYTAILPARTTVTRHIADRILSDQSLRAAHVMETNYLETNKVLAAAGLGWTLVPESMVDEQLCTLDIPQLTASRTLGFVVHQHRTLGSAAEHFAALLRRSRSENTH